MGLTEEQLDELKKAKYKPFYDAEDWQGAADEVKSADIRLPARPVPPGTVGPWFSSEMVFMIFGPWANDAQKDACDKFLRMWATMEKWEVVNVGSPAFREMLEKMAIAGIIVDNERFGSVQAQIESVCTVRWEPTANEVMNAVLDGEGRVKL